MCKLTWKENITKSGNSYYRLLPSMRDTEETASSLLPTPNLWPTATARDWRSGKTSEKTMNRNSRPLNEVVVSEEKMWPTPMAHEARLGYQDRSRGKKGTQESLTTKVINNLGGRKSVCGQLNTAWVEWLMGFPIGWTELKE